MGSIVNPYIAVRDGKARAAAEFYQAVFGGELNVSTFGELGAAHEGLDPAWVMHGQVSTPAGDTIMVSAAAGAGITGGDNISVSLSGDAGDELMGYFGSLSDGGNVTM